MPAHTASSIDPKLTPKTASQGGSPDADRPGLQTAPSHAPGLEAAPTGTPPGYPAADSEQRTADRGPRSLFRLEGVHKAYAGRSVLEIDLEVQQGEVLALVGPSGAGKSTLLRLLNFLESPDRGLLSYSGQLAGPGLSLALRREVTTVFQRPALLRDSVERNIAFGLSLRGEKDGRAKVMAAMERLGLLDLRRAQARTLSGGEAQRVALARALVVEPKVLLLDEPTANLDPYNVGLIEEVVLQLNRERGTTLVLVTHNVFQARRLAHRVGLLLGGRLVELSSSADFFERPVDPRTRAFVNGEMVY